MKNLLIVVLLFSATVSFSQSDAESFFVKKNNNSLIFYLDEVGDITTKGKASYYRSTSIVIDNVTLGFSGSTNDYFINNQKAWEGNYTNGNLNGEVKSYYQNNQTKYKGYFIQALRDSTWTFYYDNGNIEKIIHFNKNTDYIKEFYRKDGKPVFVNGNGKYSSSVIEQYKSTAEFKIKGSIVNGKMEGKWQWSDEGMSGTDFFENGNYTKSLALGGKQMVSLLGFELHENVDLFKFIALPGNNTEIKKDVNVTGIPVTFKNTYFENSSYFDLSDPNNQPLKYKSSVYLDTTFTPDISRYIVECINENKITKFWCFIQFVINDKSQIENIVIQSDNDLISNKLNQVLANMKNFEAVKRDAQPIKCDVYMCCLYDNGHLNFPVYNYNNQTFNISDLLQRQIGW